MSQSSFSSWKSSESRKRARTSSPEYSRKSQRKRSILTLKRRYIELSSQSSTESFTKRDNDDSQSTTSLSITTAEPLEQNTNTTDYTILATQYGINVNAAKKYYSILTSTPQVPIIRTLSIKQEIPSPSKILQTSPVFGTRRRGRPKIKTEPQSEEKNESRKKNLSKRACRNIRDYFETLDKVKVKSEPVSDDALEELQNSEVEQYYSHQSLESQNYQKANNQSLFQSKSIIDYEQNYTHELSASQTLSQSTDLTVSTDVTESNNFIQSSQQSRRSKSLSQNFKQDILKSNSHLSQNNNFTKSSESLSQKSRKKLKTSKSKVSQSLPSKQWEEMIDSSEDEFIKTKLKKSFASSNPKNEKNEILLNPFTKSKKKFQKIKSLKVNDPLLREKKIASKNNSIKKKKLLKTFPLNDNESNEKILENASDIKIENEDIGKEIKEKKSLKYIKNKHHINVKKPEIMSEDSNTINLCGKSSINSLSVNCQYFNSKTVEDATSTDNHSFSSSPVLSFGADRSDFDQDPIIPSNPSHDIVDNNPDEANNDDKLEEENDLNDSFLSLDIIESPTKDNFESPQKYNFIKAVNKSKGKPKIISDNTLPNNTIIVSNSKNIGVRKLQLNPNNNKVTTIDSNGLGFSSPKPSADQKSNRKTEQTNSASPFPQPSFNGATNIFISNQSQKQAQLQQQQSYCTENHNSVEESFDSLCQDVTELTNIDGQTESITLYKGNDDNDVDANVVNVSSLNINNTKNSRIEEAKCNLFNNDEKEKSISSATSNNSRKSPISFQHSFRIPLKLKSPNTIKTEENIISTKPPKRLQQHNLPQSIDLLKSVQQQQSQSISQQTTSPLEKSSVFINKDPRLNRSLSPVKTANIVSRDPRLNKSISPVKSSVLSDAKLILSNNRLSPVKVSDQMSECSDPRIRKRKEREESENLVKLQEGIAAVKRENESLTIDDSKVANNRQIQKKPSVFERLGRKSPSPNKQDFDVTKQLIEIVKAGKSRTMGHYDSDDECMSIHPGHMFSSDEESNASPPHRKFTSERRRIYDEMRNKPISVKDRLTWNNTNVMGQHKPISFATPTMKAATTKSINRITFGTTNQSVPVNDSTTMQVPKMSGMAAYAETCKKLSFNTYGNNDPAFNDHFFKTNTANLNDKYYKMNAAQMLKDVDSLNQHEIGNCNVTFGSRNMFQQQPSNTNSHAVADKARILFFKSYCFRLLRKGNCSNEMSTCHFSHNMEPLKKLIATKKLELLLPILDCAIQLKLDYFLQCVWKSLLPILHNEAFNIYNKLYQADLCSEQYVHELFDYCINTKLHTVESFVKKLAPFIQTGDRERVRTICIAIKAKLADGFCWETIKGLSQKAVPPIDMIELTILQCLKRKKQVSHINEVYDLVKNKMNNLERNKMSQNMLQQFYNLVQKQCLVKEKEVLNTLPFPNTTNEIKDIITSSPAVSRRPSMESVRSIESENQAISAKISPALSKNKLTSPLSPIASCNMQQPFDSPVEVRITTPNKGESTNFSEYKVKRVESNEPESRYRKRFWKLYLTATNINEGLDHGDYDYVWRTLDEFSKQTQQDHDLLKRAYYHILCKKLKSCESHISEIIKRAVRNRWPATQKSFSLLFEVGVCALIDLANNELWVMALRLMNSMKTIEPEEPMTTFVLICAEIYLANNDPLEALYLLQRTRLIKTNRDEWLTKDHVKDDEKHRNKVVVILLKALSYVDPDKTVYLFKTLLNDQYIYYYPIDLRLYLDKLILLLLLHEEEELAADMCRLVIDNDLTVQRSTYRELITRMLSVDEVFANQILDYAIHLGYYNDIQIKNGFTSVIIDVNCSEEELYLILKRLIRILVLNVGPVIHRLKPNQLKVTMIFEDIPDEKRLYRNEIAVMRKDTYIGIRTLVNKILTTRFTPLIRISRGKSGKICKIMSRTLVDYLKHWN